MNKQIFFSVIGLVLPISIGAIDIVVPPIDEGWTNVQWSYYENTVLWPDWQTIKEDSNFVITVLRVINEYMRRSIGIITFWLLIYFGIDIIQDPTSAKILEKLKAIGRIIIGILIIILVYTTIRFVVNLY